jgi:hypothetical protein
VILAYPPEAVIAEKFQAMVALGIANSRMKDFFDMWTFATTRHFDAARLSQSIRRTFEQRRTDLPATPPVALTDEFLLDTMKRTQWAAFCKRLGIRDMPALDAIGPVLIRFLMPVVEQARQQETDALIWEPPGLDLGERQSGRRSNRALRWSTRPRRRVCRRHLFAIYCQ